MYKRERVLLFLPVLLRDDNQHDEYEDAHNPKNKNNRERESSL